MTLTRRFALALSFALLAGVGRAEEMPEGEVVAVPSGREVRLIEVITDAAGPQGVTARFRFLASGLAAGQLAAAMPDMQALCDSYALPRTQGMVPPPRQIIISMAGAPVAFGEPAPDVVQFFVAFGFGSGVCTVETF